MSADRVIHFGRYRVFPELRLLLREEQKVELGSRAFDVLCLLLQAGATVVSKDDLMAKVWAGAVVEENNLQAQISAIRRALGPDRDMISTEFGRGYRLTAPGSATPGTQQPSNEPRLGLPELPHAVTPILGREKELRDIEQLIDGRRCVTLAGPGGIGKTRLAIEVGRQIRARFRDGVCLAEMGRVTDGDLVWPTIAAAVCSPSSIANPEDQIKSHIRDKHLLLIIDNCEHLADDIAKSVETLLQCAADLHILATAQEPLGAEGEHVYRISPLSVPSVETENAAAALSHSAVQLFVERASANAYAFELGDANTRDVIAICRRLDGMPLALELAAARVSALGLRGVMAGLDDRFKLLTAGRRTALPRHRTLRSTVDWSYSLLDENECRLFRRLAIFPARFSADAARHIAGSEGDEPWHVTDLLSGLVAKSLLSLDVSDGIPRYRFLETIRVYALEKLAESGEVESTAERHAGFFAGISRQAASDWKIVPTEEWREAYQSEIDDIRAALDWTFSPQGDQTAGIAILANTAPFWIQLSLHDECQRRLSFALEYEASRTSIPAAEEMALQAALGSALSWAKGPVPQTFAAWTRACELADILADLEVQLQAHYGLWLYHLRRGQYSRSLEHATRMMDLARTAGDLEGLAAGMRIAGVSRHFVGEHAAARALIEDALAWYESGNTKQAFRFGLDQRVAGLAFLSRILWVQGYTGEAKRTAAAAVAEARALDHACSLCCALAEGWCMVHALNGEAETVAQGAGTLIGTASTHGLGFWRAYGEIFMSWSAARRSEIPVTSEQISLLLQDLDRINFDAGYSTLLADLLLTAGPCRDRAVAAAVDTGFLNNADHDGHWASPEFARVATQLSIADMSSTQTLETALRVARRQGAHAWQLKIAIDLSDALLKEQRGAEAVRTLDATLSSIPDDLSSEGWREAKRLHEKLIGMPGTTQR